MNRPPHLSFWLSLLIALCLQMMPLPDSVASLRPLWVPLVLVFWALVEPRVPSLLAAFLAGIVLDAHLNTVLGQHPSAFILLVYGVSRVRAVYILFPLWQSTIALIPAWLGYCLLMAVIDKLFRHSADPWLRWMPALTSALFWPLVFSVLARFSRHQQKD
tara:strand:- start:1392 stop:1871 length:480 start_codon:yes stop_codon:yes gene_type:complete